MKRRDLLKDLTSHGCALLREGGRHSWCHNPSLGKRSAVPRHTEVSNHLARKNVAISAFQFRRSSNKPYLDSSLKRSDDDTGDRRGLTAAVSPASAVERVRSGP